MELTRARTNSTSRLFRVVRWVMVAQLCATGVAGALVFAFWGLESSGSALAGGLIAWLPQVVFSLRFGLRDDRQTAKQVARRFYQAEGLKLLLTAGLFSAVFNVPGVDALPLMAGYVLVLTVSWFALLMRGHQING